VKTLAIDICEKILCRKILENDAIMLEMVRNALKGIRDVKWIQIEVSNDLSKLYDKLIEEVKNYDPNVKIDIIKMPHEKQGTCFIRLDDRVFDISVFSQLRNVEEFLWSSD
jgi:flagellar biosynthesis/type III secretory pathway protein FliH